MLFKEIYLVIDIYEFIDSRTNDVVIAGGIKFEYNHPSGSNGYSILNYWFEVEKNKIIFKTRY